MPYGLLRERNELYFQGCARGSPFWMVHVFRRQSAEDQADTGLLLGVGRALSRLDATGLADSAI